MLLIFDENERLKSLTRSPKSSKGVGESKLTTNGIVSPNGGKILSLHRTVYMVLPSVLIKLSLVSDCFD